jgi:hypothetical protein
LEQAARRKEIMEENGKPQFTERSDNAIVLGVDGGTVEHL